MVREALSAKKGADILALDVRGLSSVTDFYVLATGHNLPHLKALAQAVDECMGKSGVRCYRLAGDAQSQWLVADYLDVVVHIFSDELRRYYALEDLWKDAPRF